MTPKRWFLVFVVVLAFSVGTYAYLDLATAPPLESPTLPEVPTPRPASTVTEDRPAAAKTFTLAQVGEHAGRASCWTAVNGLVYDLTPFIAGHPGGVENIMKICGKDGTAAFERKHGEDEKPLSVLEGLEIGTLVR